MYLVEVVRNTWIDLDKMTKMHVSETSLVMLLDDGTTETVDQDPAKLREIAKNLANISVKRDRELGGCCEIL